MDAAKAKKATETRRAADAARVDQLLQHILDLIDVASKAGRQHVTDPLRIIQPPVSPEQLAAVHKALKAKGFAIVLQKHGETFITW